jgi:hypothetical protein
MSERGSGDEPEQQQWQDEKNDGHVLRAQQRPRSKFLTLNYPDFWYPFIYFQY